jgi:cytidylate kinase
MIIVIDGPSGTGKTTVARSVARKLHFAYFDTGAMYRAFTWLVIEKQVDAQDSSSIKKLLKELDFHIVENESGKHYYVGGRDVTHEIRSKAVTDRVSEVSALKEVRSALLLIQHQFAEKQNAVFEGRDLGTVVFPQAEVKIFLTADPLMRAERRWKEILSKHPQDAPLLDREKVLFDLMRRDEHDSTREVAPLKCPPDAFQIDTTNLTIDEVVDRIIAYVHTVKKKL